MAGKLANGIKLKMGNAEIGNITSFDGPGGSAVIVDMTDLSSTAMEKAQGLRDEGQFSFDINYDPAVVTHKGLTDARAAGTVQNFTLVQAATTIATFSGYVNGFTIKGATNALITAAVTIEVTGPVVWGAVAP